MYIGPWQEYKLSRLIAAQPPDCVPKTGRSDAFLSHRSGMGTGALNSNRSTESYRSSGCRRSLFALAGKDTMTQGSSQTKLSSLVDTLDFLSKESSRVHPKTVRAPMSLRRPKRTPPPVTNHNDRIRELRAVYLPSLPSLADPKVVSDDCVDDLISWSQNIRIEDILFSDHELLAG